MDGTPDTKPLDNQAAPAVNSSATPAAPAAPAAAAPEVPSAPPAPTPATAVPSVTAPSGVTPSTVPPTEPPAVDSAPPAAPEAAPGSGMKKIIILAIALLVACGILYAGYQYMNSQPQSAGQGVIKPTEEVVENKPMQQPQSDVEEPPVTTLDEERQFDTLNVGSDEGNFQDIQKDVDNL